MEFYALRMKALFPLTVSTTVKGFGALTRKVTEGAKNLFAPCPCSIKNCQKHIPCSIKSMPELGDPGTIMQNYTRSQNRTSLSHICLIQYFPQFDVPEF